MDGGVAGHVGRSRGVSGLNERPVAEEIVPGCPRAGGEFHSDSGRLGRVDVDNGRDHRGARSTVQVAPRCGWGPGPRT
jgi:hypothetical protein